MKSEFTHVHYLGLQSLSKIDKIIDCKSAISEVAEATVGAAAVVAEAVVAAEKKKMNKQAAWAPTLTLKLRSALQKDRLCRCDVPSRSHTLF